MASLITITEADGFLNDVVYPEWGLLDNEFKQSHLDRASAYVRNTWDFPDDTGFSWDDDQTWIAGTKELIAQYADAVRAGLIYGDGTPGKESTSPIKKIKEKLGSLETETEYAQPDIAAKKLGAKPIDDQMYALGFRMVNASGALTRT